MSTETTNLQLIKPDENDFYDISVQNTNMDKIDEFCGREDNPHNVTKVQVGLSNVPNVTTNDQTPTYTPASANANLTSGEKLSNAFSKIAKAISSLISHLADTTSHITSAERTSWNAKLDSSGTASKATSDGSGNNIVNTYATKSTVTEHTNNKNNPHGVTASQIGAVPTSETSKYNFINKGLNTVNVDEVFNYNYVTAISEKGCGTLPASDTGWLSIMNFYTDHFVTQLAFTCSSSSSANRSVVMWIRERYMGSNSVWSTWRLLYNDSTIKASTTDLTAGSSTLATNTIYLVYE